MTEAVGLAPTADQQQPKLKGQMSTKQKQDRLNTLMGMTPHQRRKLARMEAAGADPSQEINHVHYLEARHAAYDFVTGLSGDAAYVEAAVHRVAVESMIAGWIAAQPWFVYWRRELARAFPNDDPFIHLQDWALQIASDVMPKPTVHVVGRRPGVVYKRTLLENKVAAAKKRLGIKL